MRGLSRQWSVAHEAKVWFAFPMVAEGLVSSVLLLGGKPMVRLRPNHGGSRLPQSQYFLEHQHSFAPAMAESQILDVPWDLLSRSELYRKLADISSVGHAPYFVSSIQRLHNTECLRSIHSGVVLHACHEEGCQVAYLNLILMFWYIWPRVVHRPHVHCQPWCHSS